MACRDYYGDEILLSMLEAPDTIWPAARVEVCLRPLLRAVRIGPFVSTPELGWRSILTGPLLGVLADGDRIVSNTNQPVLEDGTPIGYPPLHNHHAAYKTGSTRGRLPPWLKNFKPAWHTAAPGSAPDSWCASERGGSGAECVLKQLPPGNAFKVLPGTYSIIINDVREQIDAPPYPLYYETAYRLLRPAAPRRSR